MLSYGQQRERSGRGNAGVNMLQVLLMDNKGIGVRGYTGQPPHMPVALCGLRGCRLHEKAKVPHYGEDGKALVDDAVHSSWHIRSVPNILSLPITG